MKGGELSSSMRHMNLIGSLTYLTNTCSYLSFPVNFLSRSMQGSKESHWNATKRVLSYLQGTKYFWLKYKSNKHFKLVDYSDAYFSRHVDDRESTLGYLMSMGLVIVSQSCKK